MPYINRTQVYYLIVFDAGDTIRLDCPAVGNPAPSIEWSSYKLNSSVYDVINSTRLRSFVNGSLEISDLTADDEGLYSCTAANSVGSDHVHVLIVNLAAYRKRESSFHSN